ncbi:hypothetical protein G7Y79_00003g011630 [Physcia stellaris]|nr:hypothetical protein G7Y79_00003g011630 [Physcia stellaris]
MRLQLFVLPAVLLEVATARVIRSPYQYASASPLSEAHLTPDSPGLHARFHNSSSTPEAILQSSTLSPSPEPSILPLKAAQTQSEYGQSQSAVPTSGQVGSVPAFGSGPGAATTEESKSSTTTTQPHSSTVHQSYQKETVAQTEAATSTQSKQLSPSAAASSVQQTAGSSNTQAVSAPTSAVQKSVAATSVSTATTSPKGSAVGAGSQQPTGAASNSSSSASGNIAMALGFNSIWASMGESSPCDANDKNQVVACIKGQYAQCSGGKYAMTPCPQGQQCFALPLSKDFKGVTVQCASLQDANQRLGQSSAVPAAAAPTKSSSVKPQQTSAATPTQSPSVRTATGISGDSNSVTERDTAKDISDGQSISTTTTTAPGSAKATPTAQPPTAVQSSKPSTTEVGSLPTATPTETDPTITTKEPTSVNVTPTASAQHSGTQAPNVPSSVSAAPASPTSDDIIIITPVPDPARR